MSTGRTAPEDVESGRAAKHAKRDTFTQSLALEVAGAVPSQPTDQPGVASPIMVVRTDAGGEALASGAAYGVPDVDEQLLDTENMDVDDLQRTDDEESDTEGITQTSAALEGSDVDDADRVDDPDERLAKYVKHSFTATLWHSLSPPAQVYVSSVRLSSSSSSGARCRHKRRSICAIGILSVSGRHSDTQKFICRYRGTLLLIASFGE